MTLAANVGFRVGAMRERITVQKPVEDDSSGQPKRTWIDLVTDEPASWLPVAGAETVRGRQLEAGIVAVYTVNYRSDYQPNQRVIHNGIILGIGYVKPIAGGRRYAELHCRGVA